MEVAQFDTLSDDVFSGFVVVAYDGFGECLVVEDDFKVAVIAGFGVDHTPLIRATFRHYKIGSEFSSVLAGNPPQLPVV